MKLLGKADRIMPGKAYKPSLTVILSIAMSVSSPTAVAGLTFLSAFILFPLRALSVFYDAYRSINRVFFA